MPDSTPESFDVPDLAVAGSENPALDILCFGEPLFEFNERSDGAYETGHGGDVSNCAIAAARCGATVGMLAHLGADRFGDSFMQLWKHENVRTAAVVQKKELDTGVYFVSHDAQGHHFSYLRRHSAATHVSPPDINEAIINSAKMLHVSAISQAISASASDAVVRAIELANAGGVLVSYDTNLRLQLWPLQRARAVIHKVIGHCDIVLPGLDDAVELTGLKEPDAIADFYLEKGCAVVALTLGERGVLVATGERRESIPAYPVDAIDCNGAGDTFDGAFLSEMIRTNDPFSSARFANAAAALSTTRAGAVRSLPAKDEITAFIAAA